MTDYRVSRTTVICSRVFHSALFLSDRLLFFLPAHLPFFLPDSLSFILPAPLRQALIEISHLMKNFLLPRPSWKISTS